VTYLITKKHKRMKLILLPLAFLTIVGITLKTNGQTADFQWAKSIGGTGVELGQSITTDASGNVYITGYYEGTVDFDPGSATFNLTSNGVADIFIQKLDALGNFI